MSSHLHENKDEQLEKTSEIVPNAPADSSITEDTKENDFSPEKKWDKSREDLKDPPSGVELKPESGAKPELLLGMEPEPALSVKLEPLSGAELEPASGVKQEPLSGREPEPAPGVKQEPLSGGEPDPAWGVELEPTSGVKQEPLSGGEPKPASSVKQEPALGVKPEPLSDAEPKPEWGVKQESLSGVEFEPASGVKQEPLSGGEPEPAPGVKQEPLSDGEPEPASCVKQEPLSGAEPAWGVKQEPLLDGEPKPASSVKQEPALGVKLEPLSDAEPKPAWDVKPEPLSGGKKEQLLGAELEPASDVKPEPLSDGKQEQLLGAELEPEPTPVAKLEPTPDMPAEPVKLYHMRGPEQTLEPNLRLRSSDVTQLQERQEPSPYNAGTSLQQRKRPMSKEILETSARLEERAKPKPVEDVGIKQGAVVAAVALIAVVSLAAILLHKTPSLESRSTLQIFQDQFKDLQEHFPGQSLPLWLRSEKMLRNHLNKSHPEEPATLILTAARDAERSLHCLGNGLAQTYADALNASWLVIHGPSEAEYDDSTAKLHIDEKLSSGFESTDRAALLIRLETLPPGSLLILYKYCDHENAAYKNVALVFTVLLEDSSLEPDIPLQELEEKVRDFLWKQFIKSGTVRSHQEMDRDKLGGVWSRISHLVLPVFPVKSIEDGKCPFKRKGD